MTPVFLTLDPALLIIDMQMEMQRRLDTGRDCVNPETPARIASLVQGFRAKGLPVLHVRHSDPDPTGCMHETGAGYPPMPCAEAAEGEAIFVKRTSSGFVETGLAAHLRSLGAPPVMVVGAVAGFCVNSTLRHGSDLGFAMGVVQDAVLGFDLPQAGLSAAQIFEVTMAQLAGEFAQPVSTELLLAALSR